MQFIRGLINFPELDASVVTIGNFDGLHRGHQAILERLKSESLSRGMPSVLIIFEPLPQEYFFPEGSPARLTRLREKLGLLQTFDIDYVLCLRFCASLAELTAEDFVQSILVDKLHTKHIIVGDDFHFGHARKGNFQLLQRIGNDLGFTVEATETLNYHDYRISSTRVREALHHGDLALAKKLLGRDYHLSGRVVLGRKLGRTIGVPTANIYVDQDLVAIRGVYAVSVQGIDNKTYNGVANVGVRPTVDGTRALLEVHLFDFTEDIYGKHIDVFFHHKLRDEKKYDSLDLLKAQIQRDISSAKEWFER